jgi:predicted transcriptional regulator
LETIKSELGDSSDLSVRQCKIGVERIPVIVLWIGGLIEKHTLNANVIVPLVAETRNLNLTAYSEPLHELLSDSIVTTSEASVVSSVSDALSLLLSGWTIVLAGEGNAILAFDTRGLEVNLMSEDDFIITPKEERSVTITIRIDKSIQEQFDHLSKISNRSRNELINLALEYALKNAKFIKSTNEKKIENGLKHLQNVTRKSRLAHYKHTHNCLLKKIFFRNGCCFFGIASPSFAK